jgi:hypothetical protein
VIDRPIVDPHTLDELGASGYPEEFERSVVEKRQPVIVSPSGIAAQQSSSQPDLAHRAADPHTVFISWTYLIPVPERRGSSDLRPSGDYPSEAAGESARRAG